MGRTSYPLPRITADGCSPLGPAHFDPRPKLDPTSGALASSSAVLSPQYASGQHDEVLHSPRVGATEVGYGPQEAPDFAIRVSPRLQNITEVIDAQVAAYHLPQEIVRVRPAQPLPRSTKHENRPTRRLRNTLVHRLPSPVSRGGIGAQAGAPGVNINTEQSMGSPGRTGVLSSQLQAGFSQQDMQGQHISHPPGFLGVVPPTQMVRNGAYALLVPPGRK